jgi:hypothetical protein
MLNDLAARMDSTAHGIVKAHLYPFGGLVKTAEWAETFAPTKAALGLTPSLGESTVTERYRIDK